MDVMICRVGTTRISELPPRPIEISVSAQTESARAMPVYFIYQLSAGEPLLKIGRAKDI
jgi:hypothetical protein|tara:strand:- start:136 stop:312 length:177 start_codon:yes stop_codon:yes gene_type:complete